VELVISPETRAAVELVRAIGKAYLRPLGLEADRLGRSIPADHPFYVLVARSGYMAQGLGDRAASGQDNDSRSGEHDAAAEPSAAGGSTDGRGAGSEAAVRNVLVAEEGSYWDRGAMVSLPGPGLGGPPVQRMGTPEQRERFLGIFRQRERPVWAAFAMTEPGAGSDVARIATRARREGDHWVLDGQKMYSSNSPRAAWVVVFATVDPSLGRAGHRAFVVERGTPGFEILRVEHKMGLRAYETASFVLEGCRVPADNLLGGEAYYERSTRQGFEGAMAAFNTTRPVVAAMAVGMARAALDEAAAVVRNMAPHAFGRRRRALERLAEARQRVSAARLLCLRAAWLLDRRMPNALEAATAKAYAPRVAAAAVWTAAEMLGEAGMLEGSLVEKLARDVRALDIVEGTQQIQRRVIARHVIGVLEREPAPAFAATPGFATTPGSATPHGAAGAPTVASGSGFASTAGGEQARAPGAHDGPAPRDAPAS
jgi:acyl-CoA dehydrogenase